MAAVAPKRRAIHACPSSWMRVKTASEPASQGPSAPPYRKAITAMITTKPGRMVTGKPNSWKRAPSMVPPSYG